MPKLNFDSKLNLEPSVPQSHMGSPMGRDLGGISSQAALAFALVMCIEWSFLIHMGS
jgi:hypothetical protein